MALLLVHFVDFDQRSDLQNNPVQRQHHRYNGHLLTDQKMNNITCWTKAEARMFCEIIISCVSSLQSRFLYMFPNVSSKMAKTTKYLDLWYLCPNRIYCSLFEVYQYVWRIMSNYFSLRYKLPRRICCRCFHFCLEVIQKLSEEFGYWFMRGLCIFGRKVEDKVLMCHLPTSLLKRVNLAGWRRQKPFLYHQGQCRISKTVLPRSLPDMQEAILVWLPVVKE